jgi:hypothetical protein
VTSAPLRLFSPSIIQSQQVSDWLYMSHIRWNEEKAAIAG